MKTIDTDVLKEVIDDLRLESQPMAGPQRQAALKSQTLPAEQGEKLLHPRPAGRSNKRQNRALLLIAIGCTVALLFGWLGLQDYRVLLAEESAQNSATETPPALIRVPDPARSSLPATGRFQYRSVQVRGGQSLYDICSATFGSCSPKLLREILKLNTSIHDPDHIEVGRSITVPISTSTTANAK